MVLVFKTDVWEAFRALYLVEKLKSRFPAWRINFDLDDCDRVLRVEGERLEAGVIAGMLRQEGCRCEELT